MIGEPATQKGAAMPAWFVLAIIALIGTVASIVWYKFSKKAEAKVAAFRRTRDENIRGGVSVGVPKGPMLDSKYVLIIVALWSLLSVGCFAAASYNPVGTKEAGVVTTFGRPTDHLDNGFHLTWPWQKVHEMDAAIQTDTYGTDSGSSGPEIQVRIANQQTGSVPITIRWRLCTTSAKQALTTKDQGPTVACDPNAVDELYKDYRSFDHVRQSLVTRELTAAVNEAFADYNPLDSIKLNVSANGKFNPTLIEQAQQITFTMRKVIGTQIEILNTIVPIVHYDKATEAKINQLQQQVAASRIADQQLITNQKLAAANNALAKSVNTSPNVLVAQCMTILSDMVKNSQTVPAGFSCWPGGGVAGIIANTK